MTNRSGSRRDRVRQQTIEEARRIAVQQLAEVGAGGISLNAIAREMGMTGPALYRYIPSRDALLTDIVLDAYRDLGDALWADIEATAGRDPETRLRSQCQVLREWALSNPNRYMLLFGTPVPGFHAPVEQTQPAAQRALEAPIVQLLEVAPERWEPSTDPFEIELESWARGAGISPMPGALLKQALARWTRLHGVLSLEIEGHFGMGLPDPALLYESEVDELVRAMRAFLRE